MERTARGQGDPFPTAGGAHARRDRSAARRRAFKRNFDGKPPASGPPSRERPLPETGHLERTSGLVACGMHDAVEPGLPFSVGMPWNGREPGVEPRGLIQGREQRTDRSRRREGVVPGPAVEVARFGVYLGAEPAARHGDRR